MCVCVGLLSGLPKSAGNFLRKLRLPSNALTPCSAKTHACMAMLEPEHIRRPANLGVRTACCPSHVACHRIQQPPDLHLPNLEGLGLQGPIDDESQQYIDPEKKLLDDSATWEFIRWARQFWSKPIMVKVLP